MIRLILKKEWKLWWWEVITVIFQLFLGWLIYNIRPTGNGWIDNFKFIDSVESYDKIPDFLLFNLPDGLWVFALTSQIQILWKKRSSNLNLTWLFIALIFSFSFELFQLTNLIAGTFDYLDLVFSLGAWIFSFYIFTYYDK